MTVDGRPCRPLSLGARLPRVRGDDNPPSTRPAPRTWCWPPRWTQASTG